MRALDCVFCSIDPARVTRRSSHWIAIRDEFPVTEGHTLLISDRHTPDYLSLHACEATALKREIDIVTGELRKQYPEITGFNIGMNCGESAGQTIFHCHVHIIPRRKGDVESPRGGVRHTIPGKGNY